MDKKHALLSKTIWVNLAMALVAVLSIWVPSLKDVVNPENLMLLFSMVNVVLRAVTKGEVYFLDK